MPKFDSEAELESFLLENRDRFLEKEYKGYTWANQVELGRYGRADIVGYKKLKNKVKIVVVELKKGEISESTLIQACRYAKGIDRVNKEDLELDISVAIMGSCVSTSDWVYLLDVFNGVKAFEYDIDPDCGFIYYERSGYFIVDEGDMPEKLIHMFIGGCNNGE